MVTFLRLTKKARQSRAEKRRPLLPHNPLRHSGRLNKVCIFTENKNTVLPICLVKLCGNSSVTHFSDFVNIFPKKLKNNTLQTKKSVVEYTLLWGYSSVGRAPALQAGGQEFDSLYLHHSTTSELKNGFGCCVFCFIKTSIIKAPAVFIIIAWW